MTNKINLFAISRLRTYSDGDGINTLVTSMGCPLRCGYCLNPISWDESINPITMTVDELYEEVKRDHIYFLATNGGIAPTPHPSTARLHLFQTIGLTLPMRIYLWTI